MKTLVIILTAAIFGAAAAVLACHYYLGWSFNAGLSGSMTPLMESGDLIIAQPVDPVDIEIQDIIIYRSPIDGRLVCHRVVGISRDEGQYFEVKGDANSESDPFIVSSENIVGEVVTCIPFLGNVVLYGDTPQAYALVAAMSGLLLFPRGPEVLRNTLWLGYKGVARKEEYERTSR